MNIAFENDEQLLKWWKEFEMQDEYHIRLSWIPYSEPEIQRELTRRDNCREAVEDWKQGE